jgi:methionyl-tRNA formyltransferase
MKIAYFGYDPLCSCLHVFLKQRYQFAVIYTGENGCFSHKVIDFATKNNIKLCFGKPSEEEMQGLLEQGVELFFSAEYPWKIPVPTGLKYAINLHPTLLPEGRGKTPLPHLILKQSPFSGITLHKLDNHFDAGDILLQRAIPLATHETFDSLSAKIFQQTPEVLDTLLSNLDDAYQNSQAQGEGSLWPAITKDQQTLDWHQTTAELLTRLRAFGSLGIYADIAGKACVITSANGKQYQHHYNAGQILIDNEECITIATSNGELSIPKGSLLWC